MIKEEYIEVKCCWDFTTESIHAWNDHIFISNKCIPCTTHSHSQSINQASKELYGVISIDQPPLSFRQQSHYVQFSQLLTHFVKIYKKRGEILWPVKSIDRFNELKPVFFYLCVESIQKLWQFSCCPHFQVEQHLQMHTVYRT